jgi:hypothetical protein
VSVAAEVVAILDDSYNELFESSRQTLRALVREGAKLMRHPVEDGELISDHIVYEPVGVEVSLILDPAQYVDNFQQIKALFKAATKLTIQTRVETYENMYILEMPHDESAEMADTVAVAVKFEQAIFVSPQYQQLPPSKVKKSSNSSTAKTGQKEGTNANASQSSAAFDLIFGSGK